ncbi:sortase family protein [Parageobacillus genomosp. 1]|uniref:Sortase family protein n=1 Tax=Parageobacillus genomosp. 1 TaxID=1295642 RepID=A0ABC9VF04_9BACL|nr:class D sortase [Parageobacillus genomosp. 1]EZP77064.1 sortase family protein [Parageobacillus genomosp. 1]
MKKKGINRNKRLILLSFSVFLILAGFWFTTTNVYKFAKGYFLYKTYSSSNREEVRAQTTEAQVSKGKLKIKEDLYPVRPKMGDKIGELYIPKLNATLPIYHGTDEDELEKGVGHFAGSVLPGEDDNSVLSGHRDTVFRRLGKVGEGDWLIVRTSAGEFRYKVNKVRIVDEDDRTVIVPKPRATLTVSTCYPFEYIGPAPKRYVLVAYLASKKLSK